MAETDDKKDLVYRLLEGSETERAVATAQVVYGGDKKKEAQLRKALSGNDGGPYRAQNIVGVVNRI